MIILESQVSSVNLDTVVVTVSGPYLHNPYIYLETVGVVLSFPMPPSLGLIQLDTVDITISAPNIPAGSAIGVILGIVDIVLSAVSIGYTQYQGCETTNVIANIRQGGWARVTPVRFVECDQMDFIDYFRANGSVSGTFGLHDDTDKTSDLIGTLVTHGGVPFSVPAIGAWCAGYEDTPPVIYPVIAGNFLMLFGDNVVPFNQDFSTDEGVSWENHPMPTVSASSGCSDIRDSKYTGDGVILIAIGSPAGKILYGTEYGMVWNLMNLTAYTSAVIDAIYKNGNTGLVFLTTASSGATPTQLLKSTNHGASYTNITISDSYKISSVDFIDSNTILAGKMFSSSSAGIAKSIDGGTTWVTKKTFSGSSMEPKVIYCGSGNCICFPNVNYSGDAEYGKVYYSSDYGETWNPVTVAFDTRYVRKLINIGSGIAIVSICYGKLYRTTNYGLTWSLVFSDINSDHGTSLEQMTGGDVIYHRGSSQILFSSDYGATWTNRTAATCDSITFVQA